MTVQKIANLTEALAERAASWSTPILFTELSTAFVDKADAPNEDNQLE